jgi:hypothetical protein
MVKGDRTSPVTGNTPLGLLQAMVRREKQLTVNKIINDRQERI